MSAETILTVVIAPTIAALVYVIKTQTDSIKKIAVAVQRLTIEIQKKR